MFCPHPCCRSSPPGHAVVHGWCRDERTRDILQNSLRALVSSAKPTTGVQVVRPAAPHASTRSLQMPAKQNPFSCGHQERCARVYLTPSADYRAPAYPSTSCCPFLLFWPDKTRLPTVFHPKAGSINRDNLSMMKEPVKERGG